MKIWVPLCSAVALCAGSTLACDHADHAAHAAEESLSAGIQAAVEQHLFSLLPADHQLRIAAVGANPTVEHGSQNGVGVLDLASDTYARLSPWVSPELYARMRPEHIGMFLRVLDDAANGTQSPMFCFAPGTDADLAAAYDQMLYGTGLRFQQTSRWGNTASGSTGTQGTPITLTYSFAPDGTQIENLNGSFINNELFAWLNSRYAGGFNQWKALFDGVFARWGELANITYVYEPNDDGVPFTASNLGILGTRGDVRIGAVRLDGNSGVLAYNNFPNFGDMVFDAFDSFYNSTLSNSLRLRNVIAHEHGHGLGMLHVCPANETKLMEPFISLAYDGPQIDDILNGQRHYGDPLENNDTPATATNLGNAGVGTFTGAGNVSIDDNVDTDYYRINATVPLALNITLTPTGGQYQQGPQTSACNTGTLTNYSIIHNLSVTVLASNGTTVIASANNTTNGQAENLQAILASPGTYYIRVDGDNTNNIQLYDLLISAADVPFLDPSISATAPAELDPGVPASFSVTIDPRDDTLVGTPQLFFRASSSASFASAPLASTGGNNYTATLPAFLCGDEPEFYISATGQTGGTVTLPEAGASAPFTAIVGTIETVFSDNFQTNLGWTVSGTVANAAAGRWERAVPGGDGSRGDPADDADGSGFCYVTGNGGPGSNTDVDNGSTILTSPILAVAGSPDATVSYFRWYNNVAGDSPNADIFEVEISNNLGASWVDLETVGPTGPETAGGWFFKSFRIADFVTPTNQVLVRFTASDLGAGSVVEAGVDGFSVGGLSCENPSNCLADLNGDGVVDFGDVGAFVSAFSAQDTAADLNDDGVIDFGDVGIFVNAFSAGC